MSWQCPRCDAYNDDSLTECDICGAARPAGVSMRPDPPKHEAPPAEKFRPKPIKKPEPEEKVVSPKPPKAEGTSHSTPEFSKEKAKTDAFTALKKEAASGIEAAKAEVERLEAERLAAEKAKAEAERKARELSKAASDRKAREYARSYWSRTIRRVVLAVVLIPLIIWIGLSVRHYRETADRLEVQYPQTLETEDPAANAAEDLTEDPAGGLTEDPAEDAGEALSPFEQAVRERRENKAGE